MEKKTVYVSPLIRKIEVDVNEIICTSPFGTSGLNDDPNGLNDNDFDII